MKKVIVVGGAGYIGSSACKYLYENGYKPIVFDNLSTGHRELVRWGDLVKGDLSNSSDLECCIRKYRPSALLHFAASTFVGESVVDPAKYYKNNVINTLNLLQAMRVTGVKRLVFSSSCAVYGEPKAVPMNETLPLNPVNPYGRTKLMMEQAMADYSSAYGIRYVALRYFNAAGADPACETGESHNPETHLIPLVMDAAMGRRTCVSVFGGNYKTPDGTCLRDYIHVTDLAQAHLLALQHLERGGASEAFNLGNGRGFSVLEVIKEVEKVTGRKVPYKMTPRRPGDPPVLVSASSRIKRKLGWKPRYSSLEKIIQHAWNWHKKIQ